MRTAIVTGGARGIGLGIAEALAASGCAVAIFDLNPEALEEARTKLEVGFPNVRILPMKVNVASAAEVTEAVAEVHRTQGSIDVLVNNAGIVRDKKITNMEEADWDDVIDTNLKSQFLTCRAVAPVMIGQGTGRIVNISSRAWLGGYGQSNYSAAKGGVVSLTRSLALEFASKGVTVNAIAPGIVETPMFAGFTTEVQEKLRASVPRKRIGRADDIARAVLFLADPSNDYVTGQLIYVCGGRSLSSPSV
ncbi:SDR family NAD(P)-dependent oxidoreductase [Sulfitobacter sp. PR48]|uniref:SDR family NAD(P)-dependent oxidoreductase n=1 Tax=Sulfitobacter sp. PR48 TaxID=3028383 RepID=UPI00237AAD37|nr:SDR family NAD(P)-dependent oxidoreductase [Sulfitobacter sp. PR48]MDD9723600.1 SDR family NAD(P)-dependent oxidoreductase [Sulfitobacter sp. PR48]|tara:strand:+ start:1782 stop:2528 length:747 start_codon:yes stop_codon:yes gene_type:complete